MICKFFLFLQIEQMFIELSVARLSWVLRGKRNSLNLAVIYFRDYLKYRNIYMQLNFADETKNNSNFLALIT